MRRVLIATVLGLAVGAGNLAPDVAFAQDPPVDQPADGQAIDEPAGWPAITVDRQGEYIDLEVIVADRADDWLELIVCSPKTREHESILTTQARPSHIHLALLSLGLEPGSPMTWEQEGGDYEIAPASGPVVELFYVMTDDQTGQPVQTPANQWVQHQPTGQVMAVNRWLFVGSRFIDHEGQRLYLADLNGTVVSLVHFGDDLLARETDLTNQTDQGQWQARADKIPPAGTGLILRIRPVVEPALSDETDS